MAKANFVKQAQKNIYVNGKRVTYTSEKGKRAGQELSKLDRTVPRDENDTILIAKGEPYYWWQFKNGGKNYSKGRPKNSQLTQSNYLSQLYTIQESIEVIEATDESDLETILDSLKTDVENLRDETQESLDNMPDSLQSSPTGELLQERIDTLDNALSELESIDLDYEEPDEDELREELKNDIDESDLVIPEEGEEGYEDFDEDEARKSLVTDAMIEEKKQEHLDEWINEKIEEIQAISFE